MLSQKRRKLDHRVWFEEKVLNRIRVPERKELRRLWKIFHNYKIYNLYSS
jgi:hypothetical protein